MNKEFKKKHSGKPLLVIARARVEYFKEIGARFETIQKAELFAEGAELAERLLVNNKVGEANVHFMGAIIAAVMTSIPPDLLRDHFDEMLNDAISLRRMHDPEFDNVLSRLNEYDFIIDSDEKGQVH